MASRTTRSRLLYETRPAPRLALLKLRLARGWRPPSLLQDRRRTLHAKIVEANERLSADRLAEQVERLAYHAVRGEVWDKAMAYCRQAAAKAMARSAYREAVVYIEQALGTLETSSGKSRRARAGLRSAA